MRPGARRFRVTTEVFEVPAAGKVVLHAPLLGTSVLANRAAARLLDRLRTDPSQPLGQAETHVAKVLADAGLLNGPTPDPPASSIEPPDEVALFITERCNLRCTYCYANGGAGAATMPRRMAEAAIDHLARHLRERGGETLGIHLHGGGEITLEWDLVKHIVAYAHETAQRMGIRARVTAGLNGVISPRIADEIPRVLDGATVSLDGLPDVHDRCRPKPDGSGSAGDVLATLRAVDRARFRYGIRSTVVPEAVEKLSESVRFICEHSAAKRLKVEPAFAHGRWEGRSEVDPLAFAHAFEESKGVAEAYGRTLSYSGNRYPHTTDIFCRAVNGGFSVTPRGLVTSCFEVGHGPNGSGAEFVHGRYDEASGRFRLDRGRQERLLRHRVAHQVRCHDCFAKYYCAGDCPAKVAAERDLGPRRRPRCIINRELTRHAIIESLDTSP